MKLNCDIIKSQIWKYYATLNGLKFWQNFNFILESYWISAYMYV